MKHTLVDKTTANKSICAIRQPYLFPKSNTLHFMILGCFVHLHDKTQTG